MNIGPTIIDLPAPLIRSMRLYSCILQNNFKLLGIFAARKMFGVDVVSFSLVKDLYVLYCDAYVCIVYIDVPKVHWQTIYRGQFTVEKTGHFTWAMFGQPNTLIISTFIFEAHTEC